MGLGSYLIFREPWLLYKDHIFDCFIPMIQCVIIEMLFLIPMVIQLVPGLIPSEGLVQVSNTRPTFDLYQLWLCTQDSVMVELFIKYPKLGVLDLNFTKTGDEMRRQDENST
jgi:hypothetical protein